MQTEETASIVNSMSSNYIAYREKIIKEGILVDKVDYYEFADNYIFSSPSAAPLMIMGRNANGLKEWKSTCIQVHCKDLA